MEKVSDNSPGAGQGLGSCSQQFGISLLPGATILGLPAFPRGPGGSEAWQWPRCRESVPGVQGSAFHGAGWEQVHLGSWLCPSLLLEPHPLQRPRACPLVPTVLPHVTCPCPDQFSSQSQLTRGCQNKLTPNSREMWGLQRGMPLLLPAPGGRAVWFLDLPQALPPELFS